MKTVPLAVADGTIIEDDESEFPLSIGAGTVHQSSEAAAGGSTLPIFAHHYNITLKARRK